MAATNECKLSHNQEPKIPVFTVLKNGVILKNIFIVNNNIPQIPTQEHDEILIVGRHPDCNIMLTHPSISRFHLQILSNPSLQKLSVIDLSSVHGTWVAEKKIDPCVRVELKEGDSLRIGGSSRVYRLYWIPFSQAYDLETTHVSVPDVPNPQEEIEMGLDRDENSMMIENKPIEEENNSMTVEPKANEENCEDNNHLSVVNKDMQSLDLVVEDMSSLFSDESSIITVKREIPSAPPIPENPVFVILDENDELAESPLKDVTEHNEIPILCNRLFGTDSEILTLGSDCHSSSVKDVCEIVMQERSPIRLEEEFNQFVGQNLTPETPDVESLSLQGKLENYTTELNSNSLVDFISAFSDGIPVASERIEEAEEKDVSVDYCEPCMGEFVKLFPAWKDVQEITDDKENQTPPSLFEETANESLARKDYEQKDEPSLLLGSVFAKTETQQTDIESLTPEALSDVELSLRGMNENYTSEQKSNSLVDYISACSDGIPSASERIEETEDQRLYMKGNEQKDCEPCMAESVNSSLPAWEVVQEIADDKENQTPQSLFAGGAASVISLRTGRNRLKAVQGGSDSKAVQHNQESTEEKSITKEMFTCLNREEELFTPDKENFIPTLLQQKSSRKKGTFSHVDGEEEEIYTPDKENCTPNTLLLKSIKKKGTLEEVKHSISCRRPSSKITSSPKMHPEGNLNSFSNEENHSLRVLQERKFVKQTSSENQVEVEKELVFNNRRLEMKRVPFQSLLVDTLENQVEFEKELVFNKRRLEMKRVPFQPLVVDAVENQLEVEKELVLNKRRPEMKRVPFQSQVVDTVENSRSEMLRPSSPTRCSSSVNYTHTVDKVTHPFSNISVRGDKRGWTIVVDTTTLLNKDSRKALQLLQGLKGTRLIIPRMVIRELDCLKRQGSLFRRKPEACLALEWIEKCMTETTWWIHVQTSVEDGRLTASTPPATPRSPFSQGSGGFYRGTNSLLPWTLMEILSPTTEDHILECALLCRKMRPDEQHVLLSDDLTLKIQAMAEGFICETVQEFRESLMNPFSERFLWADSSPRGQTWSVLDDVVLREKYNRYPSKKSSKGESAKGLKLILLHNSHYGQRKY
uniref:FHA domain-containing protein n=1 Tax=Cannabis sativa TaxID=3483 RepID=A0A803Q6T7_CANSA